MRPVTSLRVLLFVCLCALTEAQGTVTEAQDKCASTVRAQIDSCNNNSLPSTVAFTSVPLVAYFPAGGDVRVLAKWCNDSSLVECYATVSSCDAALADVYRAAADSNSYKTGLMNLCPKLNDFNASESCYKQQMSALDNCQTTNATMTKQQVMRYFCSKAEDLYSCYDGILRPKCGNTAADLIKSFTGELISKCEINSTNLEAATDYTTAASTSTQSSTGGANYMNETGTVSSVMTSSTYVMNGNETTIVPTLNGNNTTSAIKTTPSGGTDICGTVWLLATILLLLY